MYWLIYAGSEDRPLTLRIVQADQPPDAQVLNSGFQSPDQALALMSQYLQIGADGFVRINPHTTHRHPTWVDRVRLAYLIQPAIIWPVFFSLVISVLTLILLISHLMS